MPPRGYSVSTKLVCPPRLEARAVRYHKGEIAGVRVELGDRIDVATELTKTRIAVARLEGHVLGVPMPDTAAETATDAA